MQIDVVNFEAILYKSTSTTSIVEDLKDLLQCRSNTLFLFFLELARRPVERSQNNLRHQYVK